MKTRISQYALGKDIFGYSIGVNYRGSPTFTTKLGVFCTVSVIVLMLVNFVNLIIIYFDGSNQDDTMNFQRVDLHEEDAFNFSEQNVKISFWPTTPIPAEDGKLLLFQSYPEFSEYIGDKVENRREVSANCTEEWKQE